MQNVKWGRAVLAGFVANLASFVVGGGGYFLFGWTFELEPSSIWRWTPGQTLDMSAGWFAYLALGNTLLGILLGVAFAILYAGIPGRGLAKGPAFGLFVWAVGVVPACFTIHVLTVMNGGSVLYFTCQSLVEHLAYGTIIAAIYGRPGTDPPSPAPPSGP